MYSSVFLLSIRAYFECIYIVHNQFWPDSCSASSLCPYDYLELSLPHAHFCAPALDLQRGGSFPHHSYPVTFHGVDPSDYCVPTYDPVNGGYALLDYGNGTRSFLSPYCCAAFNFVARMPLEGVRLEPNVERPNSLWTIPGWMESAHLCGYFLALGSDIRDVEFVDGFNESVLHTTLSRAVGGSLPYSVKCGTSDSICYSESKRAPGLVRLARCVLSCKPHFTRKVEHSLFGSLLGGVDEMSRFVHGLMDPVAKFFAGVLSIVVREIFTTLLSILLEYLPEKIYIISMCVLEGGLIYGVLQTKLPKFFSMLVGSAVGFFKLFCYWD